MHLLLALLVIAPQDPSFDRIDYGKPAPYLELHKSFGDAARIRKVAEPLKEKTTEQTLRAIGRWIDQNLKCDEKKKYEWRNVEEVIGDGTYIGCADHALVFGALARACGIPAVWVKTMDADWIHEFRADPKGFKGSWRGHVFLEVHVDGKWKLVDATQMVIYDAYDPKARILPVNRFAYDKGGDPYELVLSMRWEEWKAQTRKYFENFDLKLLPVLGGRVLTRRVHVAGNAGVDKVLERCLKLGLAPGNTFNRNFDRWIPAARGHFLVLTCVGGDFVLPEKFQKSHSPLTGDQIREALKKSPQGSARRSLEDGTQVILLYGLTEEHLAAEAERLELD